MTTMTTFRPAQGDRPGIAPQWVADMMDRRHADLRARIADLCDEADWYLSDQVADTSRARPIVAEITRLRAEVDRIEACWVTRP